MCIGNDMHCAYLILDSTKKTLARYALRRRRQNDYRYLYFIFPTFRLGLVFKLWLM